MNLWLKLYATSGSWHLVHVANVKNIVDHAVYRTIYYVDGSYENFSISMDDLVEYLSELDRLSK